MPRRKLPYAEGDWIAVPLRDGGFAVGVVARSNGKGAVLGYFFGPRHMAPPSVDGLDDLKSGDAALVCIFGDLGLIRGEWPVLGRAASWDRTEWPMPAFGRKELITGRSLRVEYDDDNPNLVRRETQITDEELRMLPQDGAYGAGAVEIVLTKRLPRAS